MGDDYPSNWNVLRRQVYKKDDYTCQNCGQMGGPGGDTELHAHHVIPKSRGGNDDLSNLITLCQVCHSKHHGRKTGSPALEDDEDHVFGVIALISMIIGGLVMIPIVGLSTLLDWSMDLGETYLMVSLAIVVILTLFAHIGGVLPEK